MNVGKHQATPIAFVPAIQRAAFRVVRTKAVQTMLTEEVSAVRNPAAGIGASGFMDSRSGKGLYAYEEVVKYAPDPALVEWVFGYGSILFKQGDGWAGKAVCGKRIVSGYLKNWRRTFYQLSTDHRGVPGAPGRTVTLVPDDGAVVWGVAFHLPDDLEARREALQELEWREKQYDLKVYAPLYAADGTVAIPRVLTYVGSSDPETNANWGGYAPAHEIAEQIARSVGPSGHNADYLYGLAAGLRRIHASDPDVFDLERRVRALRGDAAGEGAGQDAAAASVAGPAPAELNAASVVESAEDAV